MTVAHSALTSAANLHDCKTDQNLGNPTGSYTPPFVDVLLWDTQNSLLYVAEDETSADWVAHTTTTRELLPYRGLPTLSYPHGTNSRYGAWLYPGLCCPVFTSGGTYPSPTVASGDASAEQGATEKIPYLAFRGAQGSGNNPMLVELFVRIPDEFTGWDESGIRIQTLIDYQSGADDPCDVTLEVHDPDDGLPWATPKTDTRAVDAGTSETGWTWMQITGTQLGASGVYAAGELLKITIEVDKSSFVGGADEIELRLGAIEIHWNDL